MQATHVLFYNKNWVKITPHDASSKQNKWPALSSAVWFIRVLAPGKLLLSSMAPVADPLSKYLLFCWCSSPVQLTKSLKEAVADPTLWHVLICGVPSNNKAQTWTL